MTTTAIVLQSLTDWTEGRLSALIEATTQHAFDEAFENFVAKVATITVNGTRVSREDYKQQLQHEGALNQQSASVKFDAAVELPANQEAGVSAGFVGLFYDAIINQKFRVFGGPAQRKVTSSINMVVEQDPSLNPPTGPIMGFFDGRKVSVINQIITQHSVPIHPPSHLPVNAPIESIA